MATYFGYVEREADSYVNWADVGRNMSATIDNIQRVRDEKKALIEKAYREDLDYIQSRPSGEHETLNAWSLNFGNTSAENLKLKYSQLKQGKISVNDFVTFRQNLTDSVEKIYTVNSQLQEAFKKVNDRTKAGDNQEIERATKVLLEKYGKLEETLPYVNGLTGSVAIGLTEITKDAEGKETRRLRQGDDAYLTPQQLQAASMQEFNNFDPEPILDAWAKKLGTVKESLATRGGETFAGMITSVEDIKGDRWRQIAMQNKLSEAQMKDIEKFIEEFKGSETDFINGILENPFDASATLTERMGINPQTGKPYTVVFNEKDQVSSDQLYVEKTKDGQFIPRFDTKFGEVQRADLQEYLRGQLNVKYNRIVQQQPFQEPQKQQAYNRAPTEPEMKARGDEQDVLGFASIVGKLYGLPYQDKEGTLVSLNNILRNQNAAASFGEDNRGNKWITLADEKGYKVDVQYYKNGQPVPINTFGEQVGSFVFGQNQVNKYLDKFNRALQPYKNFNPDFGDQTSRGQNFWMNQFGIQREIGEIEKFLKNNPNYQIENFIDWVKKVKNIADLKEQLKAAQGYGSQQGGGQPGGQPGGADKFTKEKK
jgi:hypothetical protein